MFRFFTQSTEAEITPEELRNKLDALVVEIRTVTHPDIIDWSNYDGDSGPLTVLLVVTDTILKSRGYVAKTVLSGGLNDMFEAVTGNTGIKVMKNRVKGWSTEDLVELHSKVRSAWFTSLQIQF